MSTNAFDVNFWGVRGSLPSTQIPYDWCVHIDGLMRGFFAAGYRDPSQITKFLNSQDVPHVGGYGAATTCVEVRSPKSQLIIDGGSGIRILSEKTMSGTYGRPKGPFQSVTSMTDGIFLPCQDRADATAGRGNAPGRAVHL